MPLRLLVCSQRKSAAWSTVCVLALASHSAALDAQESAKSLRVRSVDPTISAAIVLGIDRSTTFRRLVEAIENTDGVVYVQEGRCGRSVRACLSHSVGIAGPFRYLRILVTTKHTPECELVPVIGHELQHALEALGNPEVRSTVDMYRFFEMIGGRRTESGTFETAAAFEAGVAVEREACR